MEQRECKDDRMCEAMEILILNIWADWLQTDIIIHKYYVCEACATQCMKVYDIQCSKFSVDAFTNCLLNVGLELIVRG